MLYYDSDFIVTYTNALNNSGVAIDTNSDGYMDRVEWNLGTVLNQPGNKFILTYHFK